MLTDQETPDMSDQSPQEQPQPENPTPPEEQTTETNAPETPASSEAQTAPDSPPDVPSTESTNPPASLPAEAEATADTPAASDVPQTETPAPQEPTQPAENDAPRTELQTVPTPDNLDPLNEAVEQKVGEILSQKGSSMQVLAQATISDLIHLLDKYLLADNTLAQAPKVGLVKRSYDTLKYQEDLPKELEELFLNRLAVYNQRRVAEEKRFEDTRAVNLGKKRALLARLKEVVEAENPQRIDEVRAIQSEWKQTGQVPKANLDEIYTEYRSLLDKFYELRSMHLELLDYDRKINLQEKERLIEEARVSLFPLEEEREDPDVWRDKMDLLSELQQQWKSIGHVPREDMDRINGDYRAIIDQFFEIRQEFREKMDELRQEHADQKVAILEKMEEFREFDADRPRAWNDANRTFRELQEAYKAIGQAPQAVNGELWAKYRDVCNAFYGRKAEFFKKFDEMRQENLEQKKVLVERAEELAKGGDWERTAKELKRLQRDWKKVGPVPERHSNKLWNRFRTACDAFFEARRLHYNELHAEEHENLEKKKALIEEVRKLVAEPQGSVPEMIEQVKEWQRQWRDIGKVPFKEKDKIWDEFRAEVDTFFNSLPAKRSEIREMRTKTSIDSIDDLDERSKAIKDRIQRLKRKISKAKESINQYLDNMDRIAKGKSGDPLRKQIQGEIDKEQQLIDEWKTQVKEFNQMLKNPPAPEAEATPTTEAPAAEAPSQVSPSPAEESAAPEAEAPAADASAAETPVVENPTPPAEPPQETPAEQNSENQGDTPDEPKAEAEPDTSSEAEKDA